MKYKISLLLFINVFYFASCDLLRSSPFEVVSWTPGGGYHSAPENIAVSLVFSHAPNRASIERSFSLTGNGSRVRGNFMWSGRRMTFLPLVPLEINTDYTINLSADAHNTDGLNMDFAFLRDFTTRPDNVRPVLVSFYPEMFAEVENQRTEVRLEFSMPMPLRTLHDNVTFSPSMAGLWHLENEDTLAVFTPAEPWTHGIRYEIRFSTSLAAVNGMNIANDFLSIFTIGLDREPPYLLNAKRLTRCGDVFDLLETENPDWERDDRLLLIFSKPVDSITVRNFLSVDDGPTFLLETAPGFHEKFIFLQTSVPAFESRFTIRIRPGIRDILGNESTEEYTFMVFANGRFSKPPVLTALRMPMSPGNTADPALYFFPADMLFQIIPLSNDYYPSGQSVGTWIELYFSTAEGALVDMFSVMELFRVDTSNNVITFSPRQVRTSDFSVPQPQPGWEGYQRIEISGNLINSTNFGIINFTIATGLRDSLGNRNENTQMISLIK